MTAAVAKVPSVALIGVSAGSLAALQALLENLDATCGVAYVIVQHLSPQHHSRLDALVGKWTHHPVHRALEGTRLQADHIYVAQPGDFLAIKDGATHVDVSALAETSHRPIDFLCRSLAQGLGKRAALVVLSGTGHDGTEGSGFIKKAGGAVVVQSPAGAEFASMPSSVLDMYRADLALDPSDIAQALCAWGRTGCFDQAIIATTEALSDDEVFSLILKLVREHAGQDMAGYKPATLRRRIDRRMGLRHARDLESYLRMLRQTPAELDQLAQDLLIGVTGLFRDAEAFEFLQNEVIPALCQAKSGTEPVRVWVAGCSTGEEAYSVAILLMEWFTANDQSPRFQIFATDIDDATLDVARTGVYSPDAVAGVSAMRRHRFFKEDKDGYRIAKTVRETIVFACHNLISDPPFSRLDLVVCRNVLIYLGSPTQKKLLSLFHFVLNAGGYLFLGSSETVGSVARHFEALSKPWRIFRHLDKAPRHPPQLPITGGVVPRRPFVVDGTGTEGNALGGRERFYQQILQAHGPTQVLISARYELLFVSGDVSPYLTMPVGQASLEILKMVRPGLVIALRSAIDEAQRKHARTVVNAVLAEAADDAALRAVRIEASPVALADHQELFLVCFSEEPESQSTLPMSAGGGDDWLLQQLQQELSATREDLQRTIEQSRISSEEMRAANEEIMAMNEELQSANDELESSKEELQSLNEELAGSNALLDDKVLEVQALNTDLNNLLNSTQTATLLVDKNLRIRRFTPACAGLMRVIPSDVGRSIDDVVRLIDDPGMTDDCMEVLRGEVVADAEVRDGNGHWYLRRMLPYLDADGRVAGVVLTFPEMTTVKEADRLLRAHHEQLQWQSNLLSRAAPIVGRDMDDRIVFWNKGSEELYGWSDAEALGKVSHDLLKTRFPVTLDKIRQHLLSHSSWQGELTHRRRDGCEVVVDSQWTTYRNDAGEALSIVEVNSDITERKKFQDALRQSESMFHTMVDWSYTWDYWMGEDGGFIYMTPSVERVTGYRVEEFEANPGLLDDIVFADDKALWRNHRDSYPGEEAAEVALRIVRKNGQIRWVSHICRPVRDETGKYLGRRVTVRDITAQKRAEEQAHSLAYFDPLTHLPNRRLFLDRLGQALVTSRRSTRHFAVMVLDLDQFKILNDTKGHDMGDSLLVEVAGRLLNCVRGQDTVSRLGGDEFVVILEDLGASEAAAVANAEEIAEKIRQAISKPYILGDAGLEYFITTSIGVTVSCGDETAPDVLLKQADLALYQAKDAGRNMIRYFNPRMQSVIDERIALESALRTGLTRDEFSLYYQSQVDGEGKVLGAEVLVRWLDESGSLVLPSRFIPLAEETGLIQPIGDWVMKTACAQLKAWEGDPRYADTYLAVNVSASQFLQPDFVAQVVRCLEETGADPSRLKLELTESVLLERAEKAAKSMAELIKLGVSFCLDDFGTGYSSLSYLKLLPLSQVKIDRTFVQNVTDDGGDAAIVRAILAMSETLGVQVVAEGVETEQQRDFLRQHGCVVFQGYFFGRPVPLDQWSGR